MDDDDVLQAAAKGNTSLQMKKLINTGIFQHNVSVLMQGTGIFIPGRGSEGRFVENYAPCQ
jgi:hypothetical protein